MYVVRCVIGSLGDHTGVVIKYKQEVKSSVAVRRMLLRSGDTMAEGYV